MRIILVNPDEIDEKLDKYYDTQIPALKARIKRLEDNPDIVGIAEELLFIEEILLDLLSLQNLAKERKQKKPRA